MADSPTLYRSFMNVSHLLRHGHGEPALKVAPGQQRVLTVLEESGATTQRDLCGELGISPAALSELLAKLEERGLVKRERARQDRRLTEVSLTAKGHKQANALIDAEARIANDVFGSLSEADRDALARTLSTIIESWESNVE